MGGQANHHRQLRCHQNCLVIVDDDFVVITDELVVMIIKGLAPFTHSLIVKFGCPSYLRAIILGTQVRHHRHLKKAHLMPWP